MTLPELSQTIEDYASNRPFPHTTLEGIIETAKLRWLVDSWPHDAPWVHYDNPLERKSMHPKIWIEFLNDPKFIAELSDLTGIPGLQADPTLYGAGLSLVPPGGFLMLHRDLSLHPKTGLERRVNLSVALNETWDPSWDGHLQIWTDQDGQPGVCAKRIAHKFGRVTLFDPRGWHGLPDPVTGPEGRKSLNIFYYAEPRTPAGRQPDASRTAEFAPRPGECGKLINAFRRYIREKPGPLQ